MKNCFFLMQHVKEADSKVHYFTIGCANFVKNSEKNKGSVPEGSLQFFWADIARKGGFASVDVTDSKLSLTLIDSMGTVLHQQQIPPRVV